MGAMAAKGPGWKSVVGHKLSSARGNHTPETHTQNENIMYLMYSPTLFSIFYVFSFITIKKCSFDESLV